VTVLADAGTSKIARRTAGVDALGDEPFVDLLT
jgi:hypothetical protein